MASSTAWVMWFSSISGSGGVVAIAVVYDVACAAACSERFIACSDNMRSQMTIGVVAAMARSLACPVHTEASDDQACGQFIGLCLQRNGERFPPRGGLQHRRSARPGHQPRGVDLRWHRRPDRRDQYGKCRHGVDDSDVST